MTQRLDHQNHVPALVRKPAELGLAIKKGSVGRRTVTLAKIRASQLSGSAFCVDMPLKEAKLQGERELRLYHVAVRRESPLFSARERTVLAWTEARTHQAPDGISDARYDEACAAFSAKGCLS